ncbi:bifunctional tRNA (5-methylaminomethyl-2-thiouridine)(34)-methyltransferase MnmD/FAD-dependent 5-carboxymethylaminomethyl-2-thiouridine(34) oxidoreductase MnmC [Corallincola platygyrae]|uniref:tRNA 5-methylaminomethyl-2-thiouridine biosynthesis bifunctional protein MnmC n=1 Tax=Corallincola platygyrae TaxID=1193278 RepID=A0ABW4XR75_9GAMM
MTLLFKLKHAELDWSDPTTPVATEFDDVYFSRASGLEESAYVFMAQNQLPERWNRDSERFVIAETGFGTGLNFLLTWSKFNQSLAEAKTSARPHAKRLHFISFEKFPLRKQDLEKALTVWPQLSELAGQLVDAYPPATAGCHRLTFANGQITLDLWLGDVNHWLPQINAATDSNTQIVDAWYLDGFAPAKNPEMWQPTLFQNMARLSKTGTTVATFTAAGLVRRSLIEVGFEMAKVKGFGRKREMLAGQFKQHENDTDSADEPAKTLISADSQVTIIGSGIAAAATLYSLTSRGVPCRVVSQDPEPGSQASGNKQGAIYPLLHVEIDSISRFFSPASAYAIQQIRQISKLKPDLPHALDGVIQLAFNERSQIRRSKLIEADNYPDTLLQGISAESASDQAGLEVPHDALFYPLAGWVSPRELCRTLFNLACELAPVEQVTARVDGIEPKESGWQLSLKQADDQKTELQCEHLIVCAGHQSQLGPLAEVPMHTIRGQVSHVDANEQSRGLKRVLCYEGYMTPAENGEHCIGSSFIRADLNEELRSEETQENLAKLTRCLSPAIWPSQLAAKDKGKVGFRCAAPDHLPIVGAVVDSATTEQAAEKAEGPQSLPSHKQLWTLTALGSRGLTSAFLCAEQLVARMRGEAEPLPLSLSDALCSQRFRWRAALKASKSKQTDT